MHDPFPDTDKDEQPLTFGKYRGQTPREVAEFDPAYLVWAYENVQPKPCSKMLYDGCAEDDSYDDHDWWCGEDINDWGDR